MVSLLQLATDKKTPFLVKLKQIFGPSFFVRALGKSVQIMGLLSYVSHCS